MTRHSWGLLVLALFTLVSCKDDPDDSARKIRQFFAYDFPTESFYQVNAVPLAENDRCIVFADVEGAVSADLGERIAGEYQDNIYPKISGVYGLPLDVDRNGKLILLLLDIRDGYTEGSGTGYIAGYFYALDMFDEENSNRADMLYMDIKPGIPGDTEFYSTIAHEFQHLINFSVSYDKRLRNGTIYLMDTWIDEGLSLAAESVYLGFPRTDWIRYFNSGRGNIPAGNTFFVWTDDDHVLAEYATAYLFFQWLRFGSGGSNAIYRKIIESPYEDYRAVTSAMGKSWEELLRGWFIANAKGWNALGTTITIHHAPGPSVNLAPGEGVYSWVETPFSPAPAGNIKQMSTAEPDSGSPTPPYTLLTFNGNVDNEPDLLEPASIPVTPSSALTQPAAARAARSGVPARYPVDPHFPGDRTFPADGVLGR
ncbi:MAG: hypothetical protein LBP32_07745 [Spirochaetaceae bacterium]|jgi:hypothetical protein|nr:hypothetical protein [Spirochaetaceae bacterium]